MMTEPVTICFACRHHRNTMGDRDDPEAWYNQRCTHPDLKRPKGIDPVTGKLIHWFRIDSLGRAIPAGMAYSYCRDINDGHCKHYDAKNGKETPRG